MSSLLVGICTVVVGLSDVVGVATSVCVCLGGATIHLSLRCLGILVEVIESCGEVAEGGGGDSVASCDKVFCAADEGLGGADGDLR